MMIRNEDECKQARKIKKNTFWNSANRLLPGANQLLVKKQQKKHADTGVNRLLPGANRLAL